MRQVSSKQPRPRKLPAASSKDQEPSKVSSSEDASTHAAPPRPRSSWPVWLGYALLMAIIAIAYANSLGAPFLFDDSGSIEQNPTIRDLRDFSRIWRPIGSGNTVQGRPFLNFTFALNYAVHGAWPPGFRVVNIIIHAINAMLLYSLVRHTLLNGRGCELLRDKATAIALLCAAMWSAHPMQTESVTYIVQRAESLATMFWLGALTSFAFWITGQRTWQLVVAISCAVVGATSKEIVITAPFAILFYDRTFFATSWRDLWKLRGRAHAMLWLGVVLVTAALMANTNGRGGSAGLGLGMSSWHYFLTSIDAVATYLKLSVWPHPLVFDYGTDVITDPRQVVWQGILVFGLAIGGLVAGLRWPWIGFLTLIFAATLAPTTSFIPVLTQTRAEHRMYLPLAMVVVAVVVGLSGVATKFAASMPTAKSWWVAIPAAASVIALTTLTVLRNRDYRDEATIWQDTATKRPQNEAALYSVALAKRFTPGVTEKEGNRLAFEAVRDLVHQHPKSGFLHMAFARLLLVEGQTDEAIQEIDAAEQNGAKRPDCHFLRASVALKKNDLQAALEAIEQANLSSPVRSPEFLTVQGEILLKAGRPGDAVVALDEALTLEPNAARAIAARAKGLFALGKEQRALEEFKRCIVYDPYNASHYDNLAVVYTKLDRAREAIREIDRAIELQPNDPSYHCRRARILAFQGEFREACADFDTAIAVSPEYIPAYEGRAAARVELGDFDGGLEDCQAIQKLGGQPPAMVVRKAILGRASGSR